MIVSLAAAHESREAVLVESTLFGTFTVQTDACLTFEEGLLGFGGPQRFVLLPTVPDGVLWLQGVDDGSLVFLVVEPEAYFPQYAFDLTVADRLAMGISDDFETGCLAIVSLPGEPDEPDEPCTANLQAPLLIDFAGRRGWQLVLAGPQYGTRHPIDLPLGSVSKASV